MNKNKMNIDVRISSKILGFLTHLFQETKHGNAISSIVMSSLHTKNIFSLIFVAWLKGHNFDPLKLFWELVMCII